MPTTPSILDVLYMISFIPLSLLTFIVGGRLRGTADKFYAQKQLLPENFAKAANGKGNVNLRMQEGYDHSYYFVASLQMIMLIMRPSIFTTDFVFDLLVARFRF